LLCSTFAFSDISNLLFYLVPALITGFVMAVISIKKVSIYVQLIVATMIQTVLTLLFVPVIQLIYEINFISDIIKMFGLQNFKYIDSFVVPSILLISFIQTFFSYIFIIICSKKLNLTIIYKDDKKQIYGGFAAILGILSFVFAFFSFAKWINFSLFLLTIYFLILCLIDFKYKLLLEIFMLVISLIISVVAYVLLFNFIPNPNHICVLTIGISFYGIYYSIKRGIFKI
jgi:hypothetical protein